ncbi:MAG: hypothetical protein K2Q06_02030 [Parvularculaceae bacterium]|nr:hypothetical protein [Parvularculaceae bacterium]
MTKLIIKAAAAAASLAVLQGCAAFGGMFRGSEGAAPASAPVSASAEAAPQYRASAAPVGLVRCKSARVDSASECWRRGDVHVLYPSDSPGGVDAGAAAYASASPASIKKN